MKLYALVLLVLVIVVSFFASGCAATPVAQEPVAPQAPTVEELPALHPILPSSFGSRNTLFSCNDAGICKRGALSLR